MTAVPVVDGVFRVGGTALTDPHDCHCYLLWDGAGGLLVDTGTGLAADRWLANVAEICDPASLAGAVVTHYHADHAGGASAASAAGIPLIASVETARALAVGDEHHTSLAVARAAGVYPADYRLSPAVIDRVVGDGDVLTAGSVRIEVLAAPGHCDGHLVLIAEIGGRRILLSGDCLFAGGRVSVQAIADCRLDAYARTVARLAERAVDTLLPGHGDVVLDDAAADVRAAHASFRRLVPPPNVLS